MTLFLFLKQITDMLYPYHFLDYGMVVMAVIALVYQVALVRPDVRKHVKVADVAILLLSLLLTIQFLRNPASTYSVYVKVLSAFLMYFVGRMYYERLQECSGALAASGYVVVYANLIHRLVVFGTQFFHVTNAEGDFYYNDTDLVYGLLIALIFIAMYGRNSLIKGITMFFVIPVLVLCSDAGVQKVLFIAIYVLIVIYCLEKLGVPRKTANGILITAIVGLAFLIVMMLLPVFTGLNNSVFKIFAGDWISFRQLELRYDDWKHIWLEIRQAGILEKAFGLSLGLHLSNQYITVLYSFGIVGCIITVVYALDVLRRIFKIQDRKTYYVMVLLTILFMGSSILNNCMEFTQCSWFFMMFGGMVVSAGRIEEEARDVQ